MSPQDEVHSPRIHFSIAEVTSFTYSLPASDFSKKSILKLYMHDGAGSAAGLLPPDEGSRGGTPAVTPACETRSSSGATSSHSSKRLLVKSLSALTTAL